MKKTNPACVAFGTFLAKELAKIGVSASNEAGVEMAVRMWETALRKVKKKEFVEEGFSAVTLKLLLAQIVLQPAPLSTIERYISLAVYRSSIDAQRRQLSQDRALGVLAQSDSFVQSLEDTLGSHEMTRFLAELSYVHPRAVEWVKAVLEEMPKKDLARQWGVTPAAITNFENRYLGEIRAVAGMFLTNAV